MDHNLEDTYLETDMNSMDFDQSGVVVSQEDITLEATGHQSDINMEFEHEEQPMLMETGNEEIVSDYICDQFNLPEYSMKNESLQSSTDFQSETNVITSQSESMIDLQYDPDSMSQIITKGVSMQPKYIAVKALVPPRGKKVESTATSTLPRQVAIAPKPPTLAIKSFGSANQYAIAPKPVTMIANRPVVKKVVSGNVLTQMGKQLVMVQGSGGSQKLKIVTSASGGQTLQYAQLVKGAPSSNSKSMLTKVIVQGQGNTEQSGQAVITKMLPLTGIQTQARYVMQQKTVPISAGGQKPVPISVGGNKVVFASPTKQAVRFAKKQVVTIKSPNAPKLVPATTLGGTTKKVVISANPANQVILKNTAPSKTTQISKDGIVVQAPRSQLHQINVPGKGIQYIRLVSNQVPASQKPANNTAIVIPPKNFVFTDSKGNVIQMAGEKPQPPPLVLSSVSTASKVTTKPQKKLVRIAPLAPKSTASNTQTHRSSQSLLAPLTQVKEGPHEMGEAEDSTHEHIEEVTTEQEQEEADCKAALQALIASAVTDDSQSEGVTMQEVEVDYESQQGTDDSNSLENDTTNHSEEQSLLVVPSNYSKHNALRDDSESRSMDGHYAGTVNIEVEGMPYLSPKMSAASDSERYPLDSDLHRPRKACNCTKSQCLKLYCDCFANGEFCHRCNCNNCHNNLENEELRQKAIRACLDRNPNAFRPKIGKAKTGGPDLIRRHNKGCNCKRSGCLKNYCECYEAKIACTAMCKCVGCRNVEETLERRRARASKPDAMFRPPTLSHLRQPCSFMTSEVIEAVCQCLVAAAVDSEETAELKPHTDPVRDVIEEFARCLQDIISASHQSSTLPVEGQT